MKEDLLHYLWKYKKYPLNGLQSTCGKSIQVKSSGLHNQLSGPDFFNAQIELDGQLWAGNVEIHIKSSDWFAHNHQLDASYDNVILHVVWKDDVSVYRKDGTQIPTLSLQEYISVALLETYKQLFNTKNYKFINCENEFKQVDTFIRENWLDRLFIERLQGKSGVIKELLKFTDNDWEYVLFLMLLKNFGSKINADAFLAIGKSIRYSIVRKLFGKPLVMESLLMGQAGLLEQEPGLDSYYNRLYREYQYLKSKYRLVQPLTKPKFFKLRPLNFPTIRLAQFSKIYATNNSLFQNLIDSQDVNASDLVDLGTNEYWNTHYTFEKESNSKIKHITDSFVQLIMINTVIPLKFSYQQYTGQTNNDALFQLMGTFKNEQNSIIERYRDIGGQITNAKSSQAYLQLYNAYCKTGKCLDCAIGAQLMNIKV
ncbi:DUF2851 family protein [Maribacter confluentis]|uniref:DUF2851 family protein n=1 Tax=Maribacter confluentis TaxID=1656093 RepID=A0ABT8RLQ1_9FLAO|nr:DUF2851 family protein [Maribacter confluentis]MDO1511863.1 DUF2851 family protein [Maribacter confluentis]